jgi:hypothetical protein
MKPSVLGRQFPSHLVLYRLPMPTEIRHVFSQTNWLVPTEPWNNFLELFRVWCRNSQIPASNIWRRQHVDSTLAYISKPTATEPFASVTNSTHLCTNLCELMMKMGMPTINFIGQINTGPFNCWHSYLNLSMRFVSINLFLKPFTPFHSGCG